jgi:cytochrome c553
MEGIAKRLSGHQVSALAAYYASIQPPLTLPQTSFAGPLQIGAPLGPAGTQRVSSAAQGGRG